MSLKLDEQATVTQSINFRSRVQSAKFNQAIVSFTSPPISGAPVTGSPGLPGQNQRMALADAIVDSPGFAQETFVWAVSGWPTLNNPDDGGNDNKIQAAVQGLFDQLAAQLFPNPP